MNVCHSRAQLLELLSDNQMAEATAALETHLNRCGDCQQSLLQLAGDGAFGRWLHVYSRKRPAAAHEPSDAFLQRLKQSLIADSLVAGPADRSTWPDIPGYEILESIGRGGLGVVYKARQKSLNRLVAVKVFRADLSPEDWQRTLRTRDMIAQLHHPHIVPFHDGLRFDGRYAVVLEYLEGGSLDRRLDGTPWPARRAAELIRTLAETVQAIHEKGILHRDLKPSNILLTADGTPKIADFGLARPFRESAAITLQGDILDSIRYMAPEQAAGRGDLRPAADVHALGTILYKLLTGRTPFHGLTQIETLEQVVHEEPTPPSQVQPGTPRDLEAICLCCLQKDAARRYPSARELADDLTRFLRGEPVRACPVSWWKRARKWIRRRWAVIALQVGALFGMSLALAEVVQVRRQQRQVETALDAMEEELYHCRLELARQALAAGNVAAAEAYLEQCAPRLDRPERRGAVWQELWRRCHASPKH